MEATLRPTFTPGGTAPTATPSAGPTTTATVTPAATPTSDGATPTSYDATPAYDSSTSQRPGAGHVLKVAALLGGGLAFGLLIVPASPIRVRRRR
ncbi:MAG: hypothetical protein QME94_13780 [Anaerolineae bacterium]|nr:hypothetical protein [Anaerolineae bacterium]